MGGPAPPGTDPAVDGSASSFVEGGPRLGVRETADASSAEARGRAIRDRLRGPGSEAAATSRIDRAIAARGLTLTDTQKQQVETAMSGFRERMRETLTRARDEGRDREAMRTSMEELRTNLRTELEGFLPAEDAAALVESLASPLGGRAGGAPGARQRSGRSR
jgi:hypothetical protein